MEGASNDRNKFTTNLNIQGFSDKSQIGVTLSGDAMMSLANASMYATIAQAELKDSGNAEPEYVSSEIDKKRMRDKTRKDKIRQGIHKLSGLLPTEFHSREGQKETLVSILEKAAEFMQSMKNPGQELLVGGNPNGAEKLPGDMLNDLKTLDAIKSDKELGDMEDALSLMASSVAEQAVNTMGLTSEKLGNNNTLELVTSENQGNNMSMGGANPSQGDSSGDISKTFLNMQGLADQSFMSGIGGGMFADGGPLLPSLMSPMIPGSQMGGMLGSFQGVNSNMMQSNLGNTLGVVNTGGSNTQPNVNSVQPFNANFNQDTNLFASPASVGSSTTRNANSHSGLAQNNSNRTSQPPTDPKTSNSLSHLVIKPESSEQSALHMPFSNPVNSTQTNSAMTSLAAQNQDSHLHNIGSIALFTQPSSMQQTLNTSAVNTSIHMPSSRVITPSTNVHVNPNINGTNFVNMGGGSSVHLQNNTMVCNSAMSGTNTATVAANAGGMANNQKGMNNVLSNLPIVGHPQVGTVHQTAGMTQLNQNVTVPQVQGTTLGPVAPLQGTLVLHNNQLILVPNNQQQQQMLNTGIAVNQNLQSNIVNQAVQQQQQQQPQQQQPQPQTGVIGGNLHAGIANVGAQNMLNAGIQNANQLTGVQTPMAAGMHNLLNVSTQGQGLPKATGVIATAGNGPRLGLGQQSMNTQGVIQPNQSAGVIQSGPQPSGTGTVQVNTPQGVVQMNTAPSGPNQLPSALILPNGQIVPVVTQPNVISQQPPVQAPSNNILLQGNQINQQQAGQLTIQTPGSALGAGNQIIGSSIGGGTGLLMTTASSQIIRQSSINTVASNGGLKTLAAQPNSSMQFIQGGSTVIPGGAGIIKGPMITVTSKHQSLIAQTRPVVTSRVSTKSSASKSKSKKSLMTSLPTTVQAMLTPEGNIILSMPAGAAAGAVMGKSLTPVSVASLACTAGSKTPTTGAAVGLSSAAVKKIGQRIIMPKPISGAPVATIAPLLPGQPTNLMVTNTMASTPTITTQCFPKANAMPNAINPMAMCVSSAPVSIPTPPVCTQVTTPLQPPSTDILAKAAESIFQASPGNAGISPNFYNPANDDNPLQIDDNRVSGNINNSAPAPVSAPVSTPVSTPVINSTSKTITSQPVISVPSNLGNKVPPESSAHGGAKPKSAKPKKPSKPSKKKAKSGDSKTDGSKGNSTPTSQFASMMATGQLGQPQSDKEDVAAFQMSTDHFIPDLADNLDDGDDESDINDFQDLLRFHDHKPKSSAASALQQSNSLAELIATTTSCNTHTSDSVQSKKESLLKEESDNLERTVHALQTSESIMGMFDTTKKEENKTYDGNNIDNNSPCVSSSTSMTTVALTSADISPSVISSTESAQISPMSVSSSASFVPPVSSCSGTVQGDMSAVSTLATSVESGPTYTSASTSHTYTSQRSTVVTSVLTSVANSSTINTVVSNVIEDTTPESSASSVSSDAFPESGSTSPHFQTEMMGLTPMEIIQNIAESSGKEKSPKENKEPSPRISQKKLAKAGKGPPSTRRDASKRAETDFSKSPKRIESIAKMEDQTTAGISYDFTLNEVVNDVREAEPMKKETSKSPKKQSPRKQNKLEQVNPPKPLGKVSPPKPVEKVTPPKSLEKVTPPKPVEKVTPPKPVEKVTPPKPVEKVTPPKPVKSKQNKIMVKEAAPVEQGMDTNKGGKNTSGKKSKAKGKAKTLPGEEQKKLDVDNDGDYPDEPPKLEKEEPFVPLKTLEGGLLDKVDSHSMNRLDYLSQEKKRQEKKEENIFMNAITSDKPSFFGSTPSLFPPTAMPPFSSASLPPPPPFGFGNPAFFRLPMMTSASGGLTGFPHHLPMFAQPPPLFTNNFGKLPFKLPDQSPRASDMQEPYRANEVSKDMANDTLEAKDKKRKKKSKKEKKRDKHEKSEELPSKSDAVEEHSIETSSVNISSTSEVSHLFGSSVADFKSEADDKLKAPWNAESKVAKSELSQLDNLSSEIQFNSCSVLDKQGEILPEKKKRKEKKRKKDKRKRDKSESEYEFEIVQHSMISEESENRDCEMTAIQETDENIDMSEKTVCDLPVVKETPQRKSRSRSRKKTSKTVEKDPFNTAVSVESTIQSEEPAEVSPISVGEFSPSKDLRKSYSLRGRGLSPKGVLEEPPDIFEEDPALIRREDPNYDDMPVSPETMGDFTTVKISPLKADVVEEKKIEKPKPAPRKGRSRSKKGKNAVEEKVEVKASDAVNVEDNYAVFASGTESKGKAKGIKLKISSRTSSHSPSKVVTPVSATVDHETMFEKLGSPVQSNTKGGRFKTKLDRSPLKSTPKPSSNFLKSKFQEETLKSKSIDVFDFEDEPDDALPSTLKSFSSKHKEIGQSKVQNDPDVFTLSHEEPKATESPTRQPALKLTLGKGRGKKKQVENIQSTHKFPELNNTLSSEFADSEPSLNTTCESIPDVAQKVKRTKKTVKSKNNKHQAAVSLFPQEIEAPVETTDSELIQTPDTLEVKKVSKKTKGKASKKAKSQLTEKDSSAEVSTCDKDEGDTQVITPQLELPLSVELPETTNTNSDKGSLAKESTSTKKKDAFGHCGLEKTIKALHQRLQSTSPVRVPVIPVEPPPDLKDKKTKTKSRKRTRESSQSESEALDLSMQDNKSSKSLDLSASKPLMANLLSSQSESITKDITNSSSEPEKPVLKQQESKKSRKPRKRGKEEAGLDCAVFQTEQDAIQSEPTPAKVKRSNEVFDKAQNVSTSDGDASNKPTEVEESNLETSSLEKVKDKKPRRKSSCKNKKKSDPSQSGNLLSDGSIPDQITFTENDLFAVLDQVEGQGKDVTEPENSKTDPVCDDSSPLKKPRLEIDESVGKDEVQESSATEMLEAENLDTITSDTFGKVVPEVENISEVPKALPSDTSSAQDLSPSKKEKKRDRKKRRKEKHMVKDMSENDLTSRDSLTIIDNIQIPDAPMASENTEAQPEETNISVNNQLSPLTSTDEPKSSEENSVAEKAVEQPKITEIPEESMMVTDIKESQSIDKSSDSVSASDVSNLTNTGVSTANVPSASSFKVPHPVPDFCSVPARGNPPRPLERTTTTSHLVARIPKKRIDAYQKEYSKATQQSEAVSTLSTTYKTTTTVEDKISSNSLEHLESLTEKSMIESLSQANACVSDFSYGSDKTEMGTETSLTSYNNITTDTLNSNNTLSAQDSRKESDSYSNKMTSKFIDLDYIPPSPLSSARHSHLGSLAQVALRAQSVVMPASPRTPLSTIGSKSNRKDKEKADKRDQHTSPSEESTENASKLVPDVMSSNTASNMDNCDNEKSVCEKSKSDDNIVTEMAPPTMLPAGKPLEKDLKDNELPAPFSPEVNYSAEPLFSPPSILPPDSVHQEHEHSPTIPDPIQQKPKDTSPAPPPAQQMYPSTNYMNTNQGVDLSQRGIYGQEANAASSTCALQAAKQGMYDNFSPPYASQASSGPSPSMGSNPGSNQMLSPNMNSSVINTATTTSYTSTTASNQMAGPRYPGYYPMPSNSGTPQATPGPPPPLTMQQYGMEPQRERQQNRTPGMSNNDGITSPHPANQPKNYSNYIPETPSAQQHTSQQRDTQRLAHPEKEASSRRNSHSSGGHSHNSSGHSHSSGGHSHSSTGQMQTGQAVSGTNQRRSSTGRSPVMNTDTRGSSHNPYYPQTSYAAHSASQMTSPPLHHRGPTPSEQNTSSQRSSYDTSFSNTNAAYQSLASYSSYDALPISGNSTSSHNQTVQQQQPQKAANHSNQSQNTQSAKNLSSKQQSQQSSSSSHARQQQQRQAQPHQRQAQPQQPPQQQQQQQHAMQQPVKSSSNRASTSSSSSKNSKKASSSSKSAYDMDQTMMNSMFDASRSMTPYFAFPNLHSPSSRNFHTEANPYFSGMLGHHQRQSAPPKGSEMNNPFMFAHSRSQNGIGLSWGGMNHAHTNHTPTSQNSHTNSQTPHLSGFNFNLFGPAEMNSSHTQEGINLSPIKLSHGNLLSQHGMDHNALQHQSLYQNRGQMPPSMLQHPMSFLGHQHPGFDGRSMGAGSMGAHFGGHGHGFSMPFLPD